MASTVGIQDALVVRFTITGDATGGDNYTMTRPADVLDTTVTATATSGGGTVTVGKGASAITNAIACATNNAVVRAGTIATANASLAVGDSLRVTTSNAADRGIVTVLLCPPLADQQTV